MLFLLNSKNDNAKKDLHLAYSQGNKTAYPLNLESMARYLLSMYSIKSANNPCGKRGDKNRKKGDEPKSKSKITTPQAPQVHILEKLQHLKIQLVLAMDLVLAHIYLKSKSMMLVQQDLFKKH